jgi:hypothetical protein
MLSQNPAQFVVDLRHRIGLGIARIVMEPNVDIEPLGWTSLSGRPAQPIGQHAKPKDDDCLDHRKPRSRPAWLAGTSSAGVK